MKNKNLMLLFIFILALSIRLAFIAAAGNNVESDEAEYDRLGLNLTESRGYINSFDGAATSHRPPLYPAMLAIIYRTFGHDYFIVRLIQALIGALTVCVFYLIAGKIFNKPTALLVGIFSSFYMTFVFYTKFLYTETLFSFLLAVIVFMIIDAKDPGIIRFSLIGVLCGLLTLIRTTGFFMPIIACAALSAKIFDQKSFLRKAAPSYLAVILCFGLVLLPWTMRNYRVHKRFVFVSTNGGLNMYQAVKPVAGKVFEMGPNDEVGRKAGTIFNEVDRNNFYVKSAIKAYAEDPFQALKVLAMRVLFFWNVIDWNVTDGKVINYHFMFILPFSILGILFSLKEKKDIFLISLIILYFSSLVLVFQGFPRFRMPIDGYIVILGCYGIYRFVTKQKKMIYPILCAGAYFVLTYLLYVNSSATKYFIKSLMEKIGLW